MIDATVLLLVYYYDYDDRYRPVVKDIVAAHSGNVYNPFPLYLYEPLTKIFSNVIVYDYLKRAANIGHEAMNREIIETVRREHPKYVVWTSYHYDIFFDTLNTIRKMGSVVVGWYFDDEWRFDSYSRHWIPYLDFSVIGSLETVAKYQQLNAPVIHTLPNTGIALNPTWGKIKEKYAVSFVGSRNYADRVMWLEEAEKANIHVDIFGAGTTTGYVSFEDMLETFQTTKINLCFTKGPFGEAKQLKGRIFQICMAGGFLLTEYVPGIERYFVINKEIVCFHTPKDMVEKIRYYLEHEQERLAIAKAGWERASREHTSIATMAKVFQEIEESGYQIPVIKPITQDFPLKVRSTIAAYYLDWVVAFRNAGKKDLYKETLKMVLRHHLPYVPVEWIGAYILHFFPAPIQNIIKIMWWLPGHLLRMVRTHGLGAIIFIPLWMASVVVNRLPQPLQKIIKGIYRPLQHAVNIIQTYGIAATIYIPLWVGNFVARQLPAPLQNLIRKSYRTGRKRWVGLVNNTFPFLQLCSRKIKALGYILLIAPLRKIIAPYPKLIAFLRTPHLVRYQYCLMLYKSGLINSLSTDKSMRLLAKTLNTIGNQDFKKHLLELHKDRIKAALNPRKKTIAFCFTTRAYRGNLGNIVDKLNKKAEYNVITLIGEITGDQYEQKKNVFYLPNDIPDLWASLDFVDIWLTPRPFEASKPNGKVLYFYHDIHDSPIADIEYNIKLHMELDYVCVASKFIVERIKSQITEGRQKYPEIVAKGKTVCVITNGYPRLDRNLAYFEKHRQASKTIIFATTAVEGQDMQDLVVFPDHADNIVEAILSVFPDYNLIFRPHPMTTQRQVIQDIAKKYANHPRFTYDNNAASYIENYSKSALMITDMSGTAYTYALTTLRPVIFFLHNEVETLRRFGSYRYFKDTAKVGYVVHTVGEMIEKMDLLLKTQEEFKTKIKEYREANIFNIGKSEDYIVDNIDYVLENKRHPDWVYI